MSDHHNSQVKRSLENVAPESVIEVGRERRRKRQTHRSGPLSGIPELSGYHMHWFIEGDPSKPDNIHNKHVNDDYEFVTYEELGLEIPKHKDSNGERGQYVTRSAGTSGQTFYLMKKPEEYYKADMDELVKINNENMTKQSQEIKNASTSTGLTELPGVLTINKK